MTELNEFVQIFNQLSSVERRELRNKLVGNKVNSEKAVSLMLVDKISSPISFDANQLQLDIYGQQNPGSFRKLISRSIEKVFDVLLLKDSIEQCELYDERARDIFLLERELIISEILRFRGLFKQSNQKLEKVIERSKYYEHYDILIYSLEKKRRWLFMTLGEEANSKLDKEINYFDKAKTTLKLSNEMYLKIMKFGHENYNETQKKYLLRSLSKLKKFSRDYKSKYVKYFLLYVQIQQCNLNLQSKKSLELVDDLLEFLISNKNIYTKHRYGSALLNKGVIYRHKFEFDLSIQKISESRKYFLDRKQNNIILFEQLILSLYYNGDFAKVRYYLSIIEKGNYLSSSDNDLFNFYYASYFSISLNYQLAIEKLLLLSSSRKSINFKLASKILLIINYINIEKYDLADLQIENMRKYLERVNIKSKYLRRKVLIARALIKLSKVSYDFKKLNLSSSIELNELREDIESFIYLENEMIIFHEWFQSKVKGIPYNHADAMQNLKKANKSK